jgi:hypothetical protein
MNDRGQASPLSLRQLNRATLARQMLLARVDENAATAIERLCGMQAQDPGPPFAGLWTRLRSFQRTELHRALHERAVVRGTLMRGTLHLFSAADYIAFRTSLQPMLSQFLRTISPLPGAPVADIVAMAREMLHARPRTFRELRAVLDRAFPDTDDRALGLIVRMNVPLVMIPTEVRWGFPGDSRFGLAEEWLRRPLAPPAAPEPLIRRYLAAFGPARAADIQQWSGLTRLEPALQAMRPHLAAFRDDRGHILFDLPEAPRPAAETIAPPRFLPPFDNLLLSHGDRRRILTEDHRRIVFAARNGRIPGTFLVDGFVAGIWRADRTRGVASLTLQPFSALEKRTMTALTDEGEALLRFLEENAARHEVRWQAELTG